MRIDNGTLMFNMDLSNGGATCAWGTALGQAEGYRFSEKSHNIIIGLTYKQIIDTQNVYCPLGKGGNKQSDYDLVIAGLFDKIYVNGEKIENAKFVLLIVKEKASRHIGRKTLKYNQNITYKKETLNEDCFRKIEEHFGISKQGAWFIYDISIYNQDELHFKACIVDKVNSHPFDNIEERKKLIEQRISEQENKKTTFTFDYFSSKHSKYSKQFITSLLAKPFVILAGISGSGKTKIAIDFATWLSKEETENWKLISVGADWTDNTKILGYYNPLAKENETYCKTEIINLIERANENENVPFFLILDEMNLSRVERYFSDFLSKMETIKYTDGADDVYFNLDHYQDKNGVETKLKFPKNIFIIGTVNIDETTYMFSPKVLDRANVIEFMPEDVMKNFENDLSKEEIKPAMDGTAESFLKLALETRKATELSNNVKDKETAKSILEAFYKTFNELGKEFGFAYRTIKEIRHYINASFELDKKEKIKVVIDDQVLQKILPKIHGNRKQLETLLEGLKQICDKNKFDLPKSFKKIEDMQKKLNVNQFTSFI